VYPNPATTNFTIESNDDSGWIHITDLTGKIVYSKQVNSQTTHIHSQGFAPGLYIITLKSEENMEQIKININN
jgi:hypothetical protein